MPRCVPIKSPMSPCFALNAQPDNAGLTPRPGMGSFFWNHCVSLELTFCVAEEQLVVSVEERVVNAGVTAGH